MAAPALVQSNNASTSVNSPTSVTPTLGAGSTAGNDLLISIAVTGTSPTITTPAGWTQVSKSQGAAVATALFVLANNVGGITAVAVTVSATNGGASAAIFEFSGLGQFVLIDPLNSGINAGTFQFWNPPLVKDNTNALFYFLFMGFVATTSISSVALPNFMSANVAGGSSTVATTNVTLANYWGIGGISSPLVMVINLAASVAGACGIGAFSTLVSNPITFDNVGGQQGVYVGQFNQGMIGG